VQRAGLQLEGSTRSWLFLSRRCVALCSGPPASRGVIVRWNTWLASVKLIKDLIRSFAQYRPATGDIRIEVILDEAQDHYELIHAGWSGHYRIHGSVLHIDIWDGKVWIQHVGTDDGVAEQLVLAGIP
jgi:hypothetical protein